MIYRDLVIIGGGSAGLAAAVSAFDNGIKDILIIEKEHLLGGILNQCIHDGFGTQEFREALTGPEFAERFIRQVKDRNIDYRVDSFVTELTRDKKVIYTNSYEGSVTVQAKAIILATGCYERPAGAIGLPGDRPSGVMTAGQAQLYMNQKGYSIGKKVFILGSGDIGLIMARRFTLEGAKVLGVAEIMPYSNGLNRNIVQCLHDYDIPLYLSHTVTNIIGKKRLEKIEISQVDDKLQPIKGTEKVFDADALILSVGLQPLVALLIYAGGRFGPNKGPIVDENYQTTIDGIFACGNSLHVHDLVDLVVEEAKYCGIDACKYIRGELKPVSKFLTASAGNGIGYVVPGKISLENVNNLVCFKYRVKKPVKDATIEVSLNGKVIKTFKKAYIIPSEMEKLFVEKNLIDEQEGEIVLSLR